GAVLGDRAGGDEREVAAGQGGAAEFGGVVVGDGDRLGGGGGDREGAGDDVVGGVKGDAVGVGGDGQVADLDVLGLGERTAGGEREIVAGKVDAGDAAERADGESAVGRKGDVGGAAGRDGRDGVVGGGQINGAGGALQAQVAGGRDGLIDGDRPARGQAEVGARRRVDGGGDGQIARVGVADLDPTGGGDPIEFHIAQAERAGGVGAAHVDQGA